jgi:ADP-heptose:LPS heptosyltransferase
MRILTIVLSRLGDLVQCYPAFSDLDRLTDGEGITVLVQKELEVVARMNPCVKDVITLDGDMLMPVLRDQTDWSCDPLKYIGDVWGQIETLQPNLVVNLTHTAFSGRLCGMIPNAEVRGRTYYTGVGPAFCGDWSRYFFTLLTSRKSNSFNLVDIHREIASGDTGRPALPVYSESARHWASEKLHSLKGQNVIGMGIGAKHPLRQYPIESWLALARILRERCDAGLVIFGSQEEAQYGDQVQAGFDDHCINLCGQTDPMQLAAALDRCDLFIGHDSGPLHLASSLNTRCLGIYLAMASAWETAPYLDGAITIEPDIPCHPCVERSTCNDPICHRAITPEIVADAAIKQLYGDQPGGYPDCIVRVSRWDEDGYLIQSGELKSSDHHRLAWRRLMPLMLNLDQPKWDELTLSASSDAILPVMQHTISEFRETMVGLIQSSISDKDVYLSSDQRLNHDLFDVEIPSLLIRFPEYKPLFDLYRMDKLPGEQPHLSQAYRTNYIAQDKLVRRIGIIQEFCGESDKLFLPVSPNLKNLEPFPVSP